MIRTNDMETLVRLAHVNIEYDKHLDAVSEFLRAQNPDVVCMQELHENDIPRFEQLLGVPCTFAPMNFHDRGPGNEAPMRGIGVFTRIPYEGSTVEYYAGSAEAAHTDAPCNHMLNFPLLCVNVKKNDVHFKFATTHFTWTPKGEEVGESQRENFPKLLRALEHAGECVFTADLNAPRGYELFDTLAQKYKDNVPPQYTSSIDGSLHRAGPLPFMVDCVFSTPSYVVRDVVLHTGVSDHCAITATISRAQEKL